MTPLRHCPLVLVASLLGCAAHAAIDVRLTVDVHAEAAANAQNLPPDRHDDIDATLGDNWMTVRNGKHTSFFDFGRRRRVEIDEATHTRVDFSLYDTAGFRTMELANRQNLARMMIAAKIARSPAASDPVETENALAIQQQAGAPLKVELENGDTVFMNGTRVVARESTRATPVAPAQTRMFAQLVRYMWGGHPQILAALAQANAIPRDLTLSMVNVVTTTTAIKVVSMPPSDAGPIDVEAIPLRPEAAAQTPVERILARGDAFTTADIAGARQRAHDLIDAGFRDKRPLDAYLGLIEWMLTTGEAPPGLDAVQSADVNADPSVIALRTALAPHSKDEMRHAIEQLDALHARTPAQGYMLDLFIANDHATLGDRKPAHDGLVSVLQAHPFIAGVYKDLGDDLLVSFDTPDAWRCWDIGRRIAPGLQIFKAVNQFESTLAAQHPEYF